MVAFLHLAKMSDVYKIQLKTSSILDIPINNYVKNFTFIVNGREFETSQLLSDLLSKKICQIHLIDPTFDRFTINTKNEGDFSKFLEFGKFQNNEINETEILFFDEIIQQLGSDHFEIIESNPENIKDTKESILSRVKKYSKGGILSRKKYEEEIDEISSKFFELVDENQEELISVGDEILKEIICNSRLLLKTEDQLLKFINSIYCQDEKFSDLYEYVIFENVSDLTMKEFINIFNCNDMNQNIWKSISIRLSKEIKKDEENIKKHRYSSNSIVEKEKVKEILYKEGEQFHGIIDYLTNKTGGNIHDNKVIEVSSNSTTSDHPKNLLVFNQEKYYISKSDGRDAWICFDFKNMKINISKYSIKSYPNLPNRAHIKNWVIEISDDGNNWTKIDEHSNYEGLNGKSITQTFQVSPNNFSRFCRFRHNGDYFGYPQHCLALDSVEFYGILFEP